jgi:hypothetical protein
VIKAEQDLLELTGGRRGEGGGVGQEGEMTQIMYAHVNKIIIIIIINLDKIK